MFIQVTIAGEKQLINMLYLRKIGKTKTGKLALVRFGYEAQGDVVCEETYDDVANALPYSFIINKPQENGTGNTNS